MKKEEIQQAYSDVMHQYVEKFMSQTGFDDADYEMRIDGDAMLVINDEFFLNTDDVRYVVDHEIGEREFFEWYYYNIDVGMLGLNHINLQSWMNGAPRLSNEKLDKIRKMKQDLEDEIIKIKEEGF